MKQTIKLTLFALFLIAGIQPLSAKNRITVLEDSIKILKFQYDSLKTCNSHLINDISNLDNDIIILEDICKQRTELLRDLNEKKNVIESVKSELQDTPVKESDIKKVKKDIDEYKASFVEMASAFLYVPYNREGITKIAIPAFELSKGSSYYDDYRIRLTLLQNYDKNTDQLLTYLERNLIKLEYLNKQIENGNIKKAQNISEEIKSDFYKLPCVNEYKSYGKGWEETYLGEFIYPIEKILNNNSPFDKIEKVFKDYLKKLQ